MLHVRHLSALSHCINNLIVSIYLSASDEGKRVIHGVPVNSGSGMGLQETQVHEVQQQCMTITLMHDVT